MQDSNRLPVKVAQSVWMQNESHDRKYQVENLGVDFHAGIFVSASNRNHTHYGLHKLLRGVKRQFQIGKKTQIFSVGREHGRPSTELRSKEHIRQERDRERVSTVGRIELRVRNFEKNQRGRKRRKSGWPEVHFSFWHSGISYYLMKQTNSNLITMKTIAPEVNINRNAMMQIHATGFLSIFATSSSTFDDTCMQ